MAAKTNFIQKATANSHGQFKAKAKSAGMSTSAFAQKNKKGNSVTAKQARLAITLMKASKGKNKMPPKKMPMDAEDKIDHGVDEATEES